MIRDAASERQVQAADPGTSTWLSANAGSGKTRVLIDRVARLLLAGCDPQHILCLTYTRAAAAEMQNRLFTRLGEWAMLEEDMLRAALRSLGTEGRLDADALGAARRLFARAIETPGGLRIQTIHSFCAALLRRFPLEAGISPQFREMEERASALLRHEVVEALADGPEAGAVEAVARHYTGEDFLRLTAEIAGNRSGFAPPLDRDGALALFDLPAGFDGPALTAEVMRGDEAAMMAALIPALLSGSTNDVKTGEKLREIDFRSPGPDTLATLEGELLTGKGAAKAGPFTARIGQFPTKATRAAIAGLLPRLEALMTRVEAARPRRIALAAAERTHALHRFAAAFLPAFERRKAALGALDFDDLIHRTRLLLTDPGVAQWVLYRLDGGIDHILIDEAQDTSPEQWQVIECLAQEFTAGQGAHAGARGGARTIFVVGDKKQSIYSFQGADLRVFDAMQAAFRERLAAVRVPLLDMQLEYSFRSAEPVLRLVDLAFDAGRGRGIGGAVRHLAFHADMPGRVDLWPPVEAVEKPEVGNWFDPVDLKSDTHHDTRLARHIAAEIGRMIAKGVQIADGAVARPVHAGDVLILVQRRAGLFREIIRACKERGLPIAGADRLKLGAELAVRDLGALLAFLATPEDDLSLACALRSPLLGWDEDALYRLAGGRSERYLWAALRAADGHGETRAMLEDLRNQADFLRPYDLIERILTRHRGRMKLLARLGPEAEDGIDALLAQALAYEQTDVPSLTGFLAWLAADDVEIKRRPEAAGRRIRVMTVHGAKGLEAPIVILPDTARRKADIRDEVFRAGDGTALWKTPVDESPPAIAAARDALAARQKEENARLLYVALTRAEKWLIVCAAGEVGGPDDSWHARVAEALETAGAETAAMPTGEGLRLSGGDWPEDGRAGAPAPGSAEAAVTVPAWARTSAPTVREPPRPVSPSALGGPKALAGEGQETAAAMDRGSRLHRLLEVLPLWQRAEWGGVAASLFGAEDAGLLDEAAAVLDAPELAFLFAPGTLAEVEIAARLPGAKEGSGAETGTQPMRGTVDRLVIGDDRVLAVDYKSNTVVPDRPEDVPEGLLRQMGAYAAALGDVYPARRVETALLWTRSARLMPLPPDLVSAALAAAPTP